jgi:hypothetical protein
MKIALCFEQFRFNQPANLAHQYHGIYLAKNIKEANPTIVIQTLLQTLPLYNGITSACFQAIRARPDFQTVRITRCNQQTAIEHSLNKGEMMPSSLGATVLRSFFTQSAIFDKVGSSITSPWVFSEASISHTLASNYI